MSGHEAKASLIRAIKARICQQLCQPAVGRMIGVLSGDRIPGYGLRIDTHEPSIMAPTKASLFWGYHEQPEVTFVRRYLRRDVDVVERGSTAWASSRACCASACRPRTSWSASKPTPRWCRSSSRISR
jgi:hypothetical protein